jgi:hypothetical protein
MQYGGFLPFLKRKNLQRELVYHPLSNRGRLRNLLRRREYRRHDRQARCLLRHRYNDTRSLREEMREWHTDPR